MNNPFSLYVKGLALSAALCLMTIVPFNVVAANANIENNNVNNAEAANLNNDLDVATFNTSGNNPTPAPLKISAVPADGDQEWGDSTGSPKSKRRLWWRTFGISCLVIGASFALYQIFNDAGGADAAPAPVVIPD